jgi:hypothetical protein
MPNVTWQEPQVLIDLLALNLFAAENGMTLPSSRELAVVSPWLSDVEIDLRPGPWHQQLTVGAAPESLSLFRCLSTFQRLGWQVEVAVLAYGTPFGGLYKTADKFPSEVRLLRQLAGEGVRLYQVPGLHAKGVVTPLAIITGSTNLTHSGLYAQAQNANYFAHDHPDYPGNRLQLLNCFRSLSPAAPP